MLTIFGKSARFCDGVSRRNFLKVGAIGLAGLSLPEILRAEALAGTRSSNKSIIMVYLPGGPSHQDMFDMKPMAPAEIRGEFSPIKTNVDGIQICQHMPQLARMMDKAAVIRTLADSEGNHDVFQCLTGHVKKKMPTGGWPSIGACISKLQGNQVPAVPPYITLGGLKKDLGGVDPGFLGSSHAPFSPSGEGRSDMVLNGVSLDRLADRRSLLESLDQFRRQADNSRTMDGMDAFNRQAMDVLTSSKLIEALDLSRESSKVRERYLSGGPSRVRSNSREAESFLVARRLVEAGARCVTLAFGGWDTHVGNFTTLRDQLPRLDGGMASLIQDLHDRGMQDDVTIIMWGEFGRTPRIDKNGTGRSHWPKVTQAFLAGGGMRMGQVIGTTDADAGDIASRPVRFAEVFATLYRNLGIDAMKAAVPDLTGRPQFLLDDAAPIQELVG